MTDYLEKLADILLSINAIKLRPKQPFKWASGYYMPIYNDNRLLLADPAHREFVARAIQQLMNVRDIKADVIIGTSTAGISPSTTLADLLKLPVMYARDKPKDHGMRNQLEGLAEGQTLKGKRAIIYEDLISTGGSSTVPVHAARGVHATVTDLLCIFNYGFPESAQLFEEAGVRIHSLLDYDTLLAIAVEKNYIDDAGRKMLQEWRLDPFNWGAEHGFPRGDPLGLFARKWRAAVEKKDSILCAGLDPAEFGQRGGASVPHGSDKLEWCLDFIEKVAPFAAAIKPNRNYIQDLSRAQTRALTDRIHELGMVAILDNKFADIGDTNDSGFYHAQQEGFDAVTYCPFPGNAGEAAKQAHARESGLITLVLMSNKGFEVIKNSTIRGFKGYEYFALQAAEHDSDAIVVGAPSPDNHITDYEVRRVREIVGPKSLVLMPGVGAQGGEAKYIIEVFGDNVIANVGRGILAAHDPAKAAKRYRDMLNGLRGR